MLTKLALFYLILSTCLFHLASTTTIICPNPQARFGAPNARFGSPHTQGCVAAIHALWIEGHAIGYGVPIQWTPPTGGQGITESYATSDNGGEATGQYRGPFQNTSTSPLVNAGQGVYRGAYLGMMNAATPQDSSSDEDETAQRLAKQCGKSWAGGTSGCFFPFGFAFSSVYSIVKGQGYPLKAKSISSGIWRESGSHGVPFYSKPMTLSSEEFFFGGLGVL